MNSAEAAQILADYQRLNTETAQILERLHYAKRTPHLEQQARILQEAMIAFRHDFDAVIRQLLLKYGFQVPPPHVRQLVALGNETSLLMLQLQNKFASL